MIEGKFLTDKDDLTEILQIRKKVFVDELGESTSDIFDDLDRKAIHVVVYDTGKNSEKDRNSYRQDVKKPVAVGRIGFDGTNCRIDMVAVLKEYRGSYYGDFAVRMLLNKAFLAGIDEVSLNSNQEAFGFFETIGFQKTGETFQKGNKGYSNMIINQRNVVTSCKSPS